MGHDDIGWVELNTTFGTDAGCINVNLKELKIDRKLFFINHYLQLFPYSPFQLIVLS